MGKEQPFLDIVEEFAITLFYFPAGR